MIGHLLGQRMFERILRLRVENLREDGSACSRAASEARSSESGISAIRPRIDSGKTLPITAAVCRSCFSRSGSRSIRAASTA